MRRCERYALGGMAVFGIVFAGLLISFEILPRDQLIFLQIAVLPSGLLFMLAEVGLLMLNEAKWTVFFLQMTNAQYWTVFAVLGCLQYGGIGYLVGCLRSRKDER